MRRYESLRSLNSVVRSNNINTTMPLRGSGDQNWYKYTNHGYYNLGLKYFQTKPHINFYSYLDHKTDEQLIFIID